MTDVRDALLVARNSEGQLVKRPISPHLQVYRPQITSALSIFHRITGVALSVGSLLLVWWLVAAASGADSYAVAQDFMGSPIGLILLLGWTASLFYHFFAGLRHLAWDAGYGYAKPSYHATGVAVLAATVVATALTWIIGVLVWRGAA